MPRLAAQGANFHVSEGSLTSGRSCQFAGLVVETRELLPSLHGQLHVLGDAPNECIRKYDQALIEPTAGTVPECGQPRTGEFRKGAIDEQTERGEPGLTEPVEMSG